MSPNPIITHNDQGDFPVFNPVYDDAVIEFVAADTYAKGVVMAQVLLGAVSAIADAGNTGDGTVTALATAGGGPALVGDYILTCTNITSGGTGVAGVMTADGGNTGDGVVSAAAVAGLTAIVGTYTLTAKAQEHRETIAVEDLAGGADIATREIFQVSAGAELISIGILTDGAPAGVDDANTSVLTIADDAANTIVTKTYDTLNQPPTSDYEDLGALDAVHKLLVAGEHVTFSMTNGATADLPAFTLQFNYRMTALVANTATFGVVDPNGEELEDLTVAVAYTNAHFAVTIADGATDFVEGDIFTMAVTMPHMATFQLADPAGAIIANAIQLPSTAGGTVVPIIGGLTFTITDGATDFDVADFFTITVAAGSYYWRLYVASASNGQEVAVGILPVELTATGAGTQLGRMMVSGEVAENYVSVDPAAALTELVKHQLRDAGIIVRAAATIDELDNS